MNSVLLAPARRARSWLGKWRRRMLGRAEPVSDLIEWFQPDEIDELVRLFNEHWTQPTNAWPRYRDAHMVLPAWFQRDLDPWSDAYARQQHRLWALVAGVGRGYDAEVDEKEFGWGEIDAVRAPGYYARRDAKAISAASDHVLATGMLLKHCGLVAGDRALEYGPGFAQTALTLARMGVQVDTVDISSAFCEHVRRQAEHFQVPLQAFKGRFGVNPRPGERYKLIWFYESFHHCVDFLQVVPQLVEHLADGGRIILGGEPVFEREYAAVPYPWGVRLHSEVLAIVRQTHWFELGFSESFLYELFARHGMRGHRVDCEPSLFGRLYIFEREGNA